MKVSTYICPIFLQNGIYFQARNINFLLFDVVYFEYVTKVDHASKFKSIMNYTTDKNILAYESLKVSCQYMYVRGYKYWDIFHAGIESYNH